MKRNFLFLYMLLALSSAIATTNAPAKKLIYQLDGYAAKVNDHVITRGDVNKLLSPMLPELYKRFKGAAFNKEKNRLFDLAREQLIEQALIVEAFNKKGGKIPDQYIKAEIDNMIRVQFKGDDAAFEQHLTDQKMTLEDYKEQIKDQICVRMMIGDEVKRRTRITPEQVRKTYDEEHENYYIPEKIQYSTILLNKGATPEDLKVKQNEGNLLREKILNGADFNEIAKEFSEGSHASKGGKFPWTQPKDMLPKLAEVLQNMTVGEVSELVETQKEIYILKLDARRNESYHAFDEVRANIKARLTAEEENRLRERWITRLKNDHYVVVYNE